MLDIVSFYLVPLLRLRFVVVAVAVVFSLVDRYQCHEHASSCCYCFDHVLLPVLWDGKSPPPSSGIMLCFLFTALFPFVVIVVVAATLTSTAIDTPHLL